MKISAKDIILIAERNSKAHALILDCLPNLEQQLREECLHNVSLFHIIDPMTPCLRYIPEFGQILLTLGDIEYKIPISELYGKAIDHFGVLEKQTISDMVLALLREHMN